MPSRAEFEPPLTHAEIEQWRRRPEVNPRTGRTISERGAVYRTLAQAASASEAATSSPSSTRNDSAHKSDVVATTATVQPNQPNTKQNVSADSSSTTFPKRRPPHHDLPCEKNKKDVAESNTSLLTRVLEDTEPVDDKLRPSFIDEAFRTHVRRALESHQRSLPLFRTVEEGVHETLRPMIPYAALAAFPTLRMLTMTNCHDGQRKLTMALLDFVSTSLLRLRCSPKDVLLVYAGASGLACAVASAVFPGLRMVLYDPAPNTLSHMPVDFAQKTVFRDTYAVHPAQLFPDGKTLAIFTARAGWFSDAVAEYCRDVLMPASGAQHMLFTSDVRADISELEIARDMRNQMRWTLLTDCSSYMHKFRIPYLDDPAAPAVLRLYRDLRDLPQTSFVYRVPNTAVSENDGGGHSRQQRSERQSSSSSTSRNGGTNTTAAAHRTATVPYLDGSLHIQLYGRQRTAEVRLLGFALDAGVDAVVPGTDSRASLSPSETPVRESKANPDDRRVYGLREYDFLNVEDAMATFNVVYREHARFTMSLDSASVSRPAHAAPVPAKYEAVAEQYIMRRVALVASFPPASFSSLSASSTATPTDTGAAKKKGKRGNGAIRDAELDDDALLTSLTSKAHADVLNVLSAAEHARRFQREGPSPPPSSSSSRGGAPPFPSRKPKA